MKTTLVDLDGEICVLWEELEWDEPFFTKTYYPTGIRTEDLKRSYGEDYLPCPLDCASLPGRYQINKGFGSIFIDLKERGETLPIKIERIPIPTPKRMKDPQWYRGTWSSTRSKRR